MHPASFLAQRLRRGQPIQSLPHVDINDLGIVAIIDISGYTGLVDQLASLGSTDRMREVLNPPFEMIINNVHKTHGSIIKLAGDSAIAVWTSQSSPHLLTTLLKLSTLCCLNLLESFRNHRPAIRLANTPQEGYSSQGKRQSIAQFERLSVHIGIGVGEVQHVFLGSVDGGEEGSRAEYFIGGQALIDAGIMLNKAKPGQAALPISAVEALEEIPIRNGLYSVVVDEKAVGARVVLDVQSRFFEELRETLAATVNVPNNEFAEEDESCLPRPKPLDPSLFAFMESSISRHILQSTTKSPSRLSRVSTTRSIITTPSFIDYNQIRAITVLFIQFPHLPIAEIGHNTMIQKDLQKLSECVFDTAKRNGGTCRQINCDEKALSVLMLWGIEGFAHERGDGAYAVAAALELMEILRVNRRNNLFKLRYAGTIGTESRSEGTVLGPCVNLAARIMCQPLCRERLLCDGEIAKSCEDTYSFMKEGDLSLKGVSDLVQVYSVCKKVVDDRKDLQQSPTSFSLEGREEEMKKLLALQEEWNNNERALVIVTGKSGFGKTQLIRSFASYLLQQENMIVCLGVARESRNDPNYIYEQILESLYTQLKGRDIVVEARSTRASVTYNSGNLKPLDLTSNLQKGFRKSFRSTSFSRMRVSPEVTSSRESLWKDSEDSFFNNPKTIFFRSFGLDNSALKLLNECFPRIFESACERSSFTKETSSRLCKVMLQILNFTVNFKVKLVLILDDSQEYRDDLKKFFDRVSEASFCLRIDVGKLTKEGTEKIVIREMSASCGPVQAVSHNLLKELHEKSQGNPMVIKLLCKLLASDPDVSVSLGILSRRLAPGNTQELLPLDASAAIVSQLDRLRPEVKIVLRTASVAGQFFTLPELDFALKSLYPDTNELTAALESLPSILQECMTYGFLSTQEFHQENLDQTYSFVHYLVYQGIYQSQLPLRREEIHSIYANYYESIMTSQTHTANLSTLLYHLLKLDGQEKRKQRYVREAFKLNAERHRPVEGLPYYEILKELEAIELMQKTPLQEAQELRLLAQLIIELGDRDRAKKYIFEAFKILGYPLGEALSSNFKLMLLLLKLFPSIPSMIKVGPVQCYLKSFSIMKSQFKPAFADISIKEVTSILKNRTELPYLPNDPLHVTNRIAIIAFEIWELLVTALFIVFNEGKPGTEIAVIQCLQFLSHMLLPDNGRGCLAGVYSSMALMMQFSGRKAVADCFLDEGLRQLARTDGLALTMQSVYALPPMYSIYDSRGEWERCVSFSREYICLIDKLGYASVSGIHIALLVSIVMNELLGLDCDCTILWAKQLSKDVYDDYPDLHETFELKFCIASLSCFSEKLNDTAGFYRTAKDRMRGYIGTEVENGWRTLFMSICLLRFETFMLLFGPSGKEGHEWVDGATSSFTAATHGLERLAPIQYLFAFPLCLNLLPLMMDCLIFFCIGTKDPKYAPAVKAFKRLLDNLSRKMIIGSRQQPANTIFIKRIRSSFNQLLKGRTRNGCQSICDLVQNCAKYHFFTKTLQCRLIARVGIMVARLGVAGKSEFGLKFPISHQGVISGLHGAGMRSELRALSNATGAETPFWWN
ncbi:Adenylate cyclase type 10 [Dinochytrium kinnereticum]|nr:Adenylate cyclase type 10 [Dinochytrium kinnereticum]